MAKVMPQKKPPNKPLFFFFFHQISKNTSVFYRIFIFANIQKSVGQSNEIKPCIEYIAMYSQAVAIEAEKQSVFKSWVLLLHSLFVHIPILSTGSVWATHALYHDPVASQPQHQTGPICISSGRTF